MERIQLFSFDALVHFSNSMCWVVFCFYKFFSKVEVGPHFSSSDSWHSARAVPHARAETSSPIRSLAKLIEKSKRFIKSLISFHCLVISLELIN